MSPLNYPRKVYLGWFICDTCGRKLENRECWVDTMAIYCDCDGGYLYHWEDLDEIKGKTLMRLYNVRVKIPVEYRDLRGKKIKNYPIKEK